LRARNGGGEEGQERAGIDGRIVDGILDKGKEGIFKIGRLKGED